MKKLLSALTLVGVLAVSATPAFADDEVSVSDTVVNLMGELGFINSVNCSMRGNTVAVRVQGSRIKNQRTLCFQNNSTWPNGSYVYNFDTDRLTHKGCEVRTQDCFSAAPVVINQPGNVVVNPTPQPVAPPPVVTEFYSLSGQPVPVHVQAALRGVASSQGLRIGACNVAPVHVIANNLYGVCAYPNAQYGAGRWHINVPGLY